jgi:hypothetical protein
VLVGLLVAAASCCRARVSCVRSESEPRVTKGRPACGLSAVDLEQYIFTVRSLVLTRREISNSMSAENFKKTSLSGKKSESVRSEQLNSLTN